MAEIAEASLETVVSINRLSLLVLDWLYRGI